MKMTVTASTITITPITTMILNTNTGACNCIKVIWYNIEPQFGKACFVPALQIIATIVVQCDHSQIGGWKYK